VIVIEAQPPIFPTLRPATDGAEAIALLPKRSEGVLGQTEAFADVPLVVAAPINRTMLVRVARAPFAGVGGDAGFALATEPIGVRAAGVELSP
jgi:hypothetical protein